MVLEPIYRSCLLDSRCAINLTLTKLFQLSRLLKRPLVLHRVYSDALLWFQKLAFQICVSRKFVDLSYLHQFRTYNILSIVTRF